MTDFPSRKLDRGKIVAKTGLKVGKNYAKFYAGKMLGKNQSVQDREQLHNRNATEIFGELTKLRGTALKLAQSLSMDTGLLPEQFIDVMSNAQYRVPPMNRALVRTIIKREFGNYPEQLFAHFEGEALAAASIGQVHLATLASGEKVAVKLQYPNVRDTIKSDLAMIKPIVSRIVTNTDLQPYFEEVEGKLLEETDYLHEGRQLELFADLFSHPQIVTPAYFPEYSTERVITMGFLEGQHLDSYLKSKPEQESKNHFGQLLWDVFHQQIANRRYTLHADIHPGNFLFREDGLLGVLDFGCVKTFPPDFLQSFMKMIPAHLENNEEALRLLYRDTDIITQSEFEEGSRKDLTDFFSRFGRTLLKPYHGDFFDFRDQQFREVLNETLKAATGYQEARGSRHFIFINKVIMGMYSLLLKLGPVIDIRPSRRIMESAIAEVQTSPYSIVRE